MTGAEIHNPPEEYEHIDEKLDTIYCRAFEERPLYGKNKFEYGKYHLFM